jgi:hypothetical protein
MQTAMPVHSKKIKIYTFVDMNVSGGWDGMYVRCSQIHNALYIIYVNAEYNRLVL